MFNRGMVFAAPQDKRQHNQPSFDRSMTGAVSLQV